MLLVQIWTLEPVLTNIANLFGLVVVLNCTNKHVLSTSGDTVTAQNCTASFLNGTSYVVASGNFKVDTASDFGYMQIKILTSRF